MLQRAVVLNNKLGLKEGPPIELGLLAIDFAVVITGVSLHTFHINILMDRVSIVR